MENVNHISDTAYWIAAFRAQETERTDAVFKDPLALKIVGTRKDAIIESIPHPEVMAFMMTVRTVAIDRLIRFAIEQGVDTVINLGAGMDTRPYRLNIPEHIRWIEVDFANIIEIKNSLLAEEKAVCRLQRIASDLTDSNVRKELFEKLASDTQNALIITEGVIGYLTNEQAEELSKSLVKVSSFKYWIQDYSQGKMRRGKHTKDLEKKLERSPLQFKEPQPLQFFGSHGWKVLQNIFLLDEADRIGRKFPIMFPWNLVIRMFPRMIRKKANETYGYVLFNK